MEKLFSHFVSAICLPLFVLARSGFCLSFGLEPWSSGFSRYSFSYVRESSVLVFSAGCLSRW
jgi:hypothetical protein